MKKNSLIHVKFSYDEAVQSKRDILISKLGLLNILKTIGKYQELREKEIETKIKIYTSLKELNIDLRKVKTNIFPKITTPEILAEKEIPINKIQKKEKTIPKKKTEKIENNLDKELRTIQEQLKKLE